MTNCAVVPGKGVCEKQFPFLLFEAGEQKVQRRIEYLLPWFSNDSFVVA